MFFANTDRPTVSALRDCLDALDLRDPVLADRACVDAVRCAHADEFVTGVERVRQHLEAQEYDAARCTVEILIRPKFESRSDAQAAYKTAIEGSAA